MKLVRWEFQGLHIPMAEDDDGVLWSTEQPILDAFKVDKKAIKYVLNRYSGRFSDSLRVENLDSKEFIRKHRVEFGVLRVRDDMHFWSETNMLKLATLVNTPEASVFVDRLVDFMKFHARRTYQKRLISPCLKAGALRRFW